MKTKTKRELRLEELEASIASLRLQIPQLERALLGGSTTLDYVAVRGLKDEIEACRSELRSAERKLGRL